MNPTNIQKRIEAEIRALQSHEEKYAGIEYKPDLESGTIHIKNTNGPYEDAIFHLSVRLGNNYPFTPPQIQFTTPIFHPNFATNGSMSLSILRDDWTPSMNIPSALLIIRELIIEPCPNGPLNIEAAELYTRDRLQFDHQAKEHTQKYAM